MALEKLGIPKDLEWDASSRFAEDFLVTLTMEFNNLRKQVVELHNEVVDLQNEISVLKNQVDPFGF